MIQPKERQSLITIGSVSLVHEAMAVFLLNKPSVSFLVLAIVCSCMNVTFVVFHPPLLIV